MNTERDNVDRSNPKRPPVLDYQPPSGRGSYLPAKTRWMLILSVVFHLIVFGVYAATLDGGDTARRCAGVSLGYWLATALVLWRHGYKPSLVDLLFIGFGYPVMLAIAETAMNIR